MENTHKKDISKLSSGSDSNPTQTSLAAGWYELYSVLMVRIILSSVRAGARGEDFPVPALLLYKGRCRVLCSPCGQVLLWSGQHWRRTRVSIAASYRLMV